MPAPRLHRRLLASYLLLLAITLVPATILIDHGLEAAGRENLREALVREAHIVAFDFARARPADLVAWVEGLTRVVDARITIIGPDGRVLADSGVPVYELAGLENHAARPEVAQALAGGTGVDVRRSVTVNRETFYVAVPTERGGPVVRVALPLVEVERMMARTRGAFLLAALLALALASLLAYGLTRLISRPLVVMTRAAHAMIHGDFAAPLPPLSSDEFGELNRALQELRRQLAERIAELHAEGIQLRTVLDAMSEGVALVERGVIVTANLAFGILLDATGSVEQRTPLEVARLPDLADAIAWAVARGEAVEREILTATRVLHLQVRPLDVLRQRALVVLLDVTQARRLERVRRDFVANASHELRTPVAAIAAAAETLAAGAADDPAARGTFIAILERHAQRLLRLTSDLLDLARLESGLKPRIEAVSVRAVLTAVLAALRAQAEDKGIKLIEGLPDEPITVLAERAAVEQILTNLIENAIKYTPTGGEVMVSATIGHERVRLEVADTGVGIPAEHQPRLFERFYRVDEDRSRALGGTGLGLAIVRHLALAFDGEVSVDSEPGRGSRFHVILPRA